MEGNSSRVSNYTSGFKQILLKYLSFVGPGIMVSVAYMDPGNYSTAVSAGALYEYKLLFIIFMSNIFAVVLQSLCIKLGTVTGLDLAEMCRLNLPPSANLFLYVCAEIAIIATDLAEVVGTAIALEILFGIPILYGVFITVIDVLVILMVYHKDGSMKRTRSFEIFVSFLVLSTCLCFVIELFKCNFEEGSFKRIFLGFLPTDKQIFEEANALFLSCGIVGSTVMPHSLFLGSALVQPRLKEYDKKNGLYKESNNQDEGASQNQADDQSRGRNKINTLSDSKNLLNKYKPSISAIRYCLNYSYTELALSLFTIAVFVNSAILIVAGNSLFGKPEAEDADLLSIYELLSHYISPAAGLIFALSMLFSGQSAGIVCTMAGQIVSEGFLNWTIAPWKRRITTRILAIIPVLIVILILGREGISRVMNASQVVLSFILPAVVAPLIWFTCKKEHMTIKSVSEQNENSALLGSSSDNQSIETFENGSFLRILSIITWIIITFLNMYLIWLFIQGYDI